ncbi:MAG: tRNA lysidine(34) synthetase TilS, partial [Erysipelotrichales bacterium]|nr:tRNA lysidine(34) synthetase TilS [Erysipelotrichales bacterium]
KIREEICAQNRELSKKIEELRRCAECLDPFDPKAYGAMNPKVRTSMIRQYLIDEGVEEAYHFSDARLTEIDRQPSLGTNRRILLSKTTVWDLDYGKLCLHEPAVAYEIMRKNRHAAENPYFFTSSEGESMEGVYLTKGDFPVKIRSPKEGDEIRLRYGTKKLSRFFIDRKIPRYARETWPVLENKDGKIVLVPGIGCDVDHYKLPYNWYLRRKSGKNLTNP